MRTLFAFIILFVSSIMAEPVPTTIIALDATETGIYFPIEVAVPVAEWNQATDVKIEFNPFTFNLWQSNDKLSLERIANKKDPVREKKVYPTAEWNVVTR